MKGGIVFGVQALRKGAWRWIWIIKMHQTSKYKPAYITNVSFVFFFCCVIRCKHVNSRDPCSTNKGELKTMYSQKKG